MSGFDFGALRDPDAPLPGAGQRASVDQRASQLRSRARRNRFAASAVSFVAVAAIVVGVVATTRDTGPQVSVTGPSTSSTPTSTTTPGGAAGDRFVPPTTTENGLVVMPVTFPDGETTTLRYPPAMKIAQLGFSGGIGVSGVEALITYETIAHHYGVNGPPPNELALQLGPWLVRAAGLDAKQRATWTSNLTGGVDANGYLLLRAAAPLELSNEFDGGFGSFTAGDDEVELSSHLHCGQPPSDTTTRRHFVNGDGTQGESWCVDNSLHVAVSGSPAFVELAGNLSVSSLGLREVGTTTTTTTSPPAAASGAVSASFVSADRGWVVETDGRIDMTTNAGTKQWSVVGNFPTRGPNTRIRFANASVGFGFNRFNTNALYETTDGGATWTRLQTPFSTVYDLEISRGVVYAVSFDQAATKFRIWSTPSDNIAWVEDPLAIPVGAGPDPSIQLVFSNGAGWLLEVDRTVVAGARMSTSGTWSAWTPPCSKANGPAFLAAWSATDLIATCDEGVWGSPPPNSTAVHLSHDAGATFLRVPAPVFGAVAAADPNYAAIVKGGTIRRSVDGGRTWNVVLDVTDPNADQPSDFGFTTPAQGFVIFGNGQMFMTFDSGLTWGLVTLP